MWETNIKNGDRTTWVLGCTIGYDIRRALHFPIDMEWMDTHENMWQCHEVLHRVALIEYRSTGIKSHHFLVFIIVILHE